MFLKTGDSVKLTSTRYEVIQAKISVEVIKQNKEKIEIVRVSLRVSLMADARGLTGLGIHTTFFILYLLLIVATPKIVKGRYSKG